MIPETIEIKGEIEMKALITMVLLLFTVICILCLLWKDNYKYPVCPKCGDNLACKRNEFGRIICQTHGDVTD